MFLAAGLLVWLLVPRETDLWKRARLLEHEEDYRLPGGLRQIATWLKSDWPYCWTSPTQFFSLCLSHESVPNFVVYETDARTLVRSDIAALNSSLRNHNYPAIIIAAGSPNQRITVRFSDSFLASANRRWILWGLSSPQSNTTSQNEMDVMLGTKFLVSMESNKLLRWHSSHDMHSSLWLRDQNRWITLGTLGEPSSSVPYNTTMEIHSVEDPNRRAIYAVNLPGSMVLIGNAPDGRVLTVDWQHPNSGRLSAAQFMPETERNAPRRFSIAIPPDKSSVPIVSPQVAPEGDRIAWFVSMPSKPPGWPATQRFWGIWKIMPHTVIGLWTTRLDGSDLHEVGHYIQNSDGDIPSMLQWTPDSKTLSFRYQGALYSVPAQ